jgi:hypothetical protein
MQSSFAGARAELGARSALSRRHSGGALCRFVQFTFIRRGIA